MIENQLHWVLDVAFDEDRCRNTLIRYFISSRKLSAEEVLHGKAMQRRGYAAENLAVARQITLNLLKLDTSEKAGIKNKRHKCGWDEQYMMNVLGLINMLSCFCRGYFPSNSWYY